MAGVLDTAFGLAVLAEYMLGRGLGIDQLIVKPYVSGPLNVPGRPAVNTAACLTLAGAALLAWGRGRPRRRPAALAAAGSVIAAIAVIATFGYVTRAPAGYGWAHLSNMSFLTAAAMLALALCLLSAAWRETRTRHDGFPRWLPMPAGVLALGVAAAVWLAIASRSEVAGRIPAGTATGAATVLGLVLAGLMALTVWLAQQSNRRRRAAAAEAALRAEAETQARDGEHRLFQFLDAMPVAVFVASPGGQPYYANRESERVLGRGVVPDTGGSGLAETYGVFVAGTDRLYPAESMPIVRALLGQPSHLDDQEIHQPDGAVIPIEIWGRPVYGSHGEVSYAIAAFADTSERNARERTIAAQAALLELAHDAIFVRDPAGHITYWNAGAEHTYGFTRAEAMGRMSHQMLRTRFPEPMADIEATMARDGHWEGELTQRRGDGRTIVTESRWAAQRGPDGSLLGFMEVNRDITARKETEREMRRAAEEIRALNATLEQQVQQRTVHLERANKNLEAFTYSVAHDLRTPLRGISGFAEALAEDYGDRLDETGREYAARVQAGCARMATLIDDLLHLSRVTRAEMNLQDVDLSAEVTAICDQLRARDPGRQVRVSVQDGVHVTADRALIRSALENLLENAWKFTAGRDGAAIEFAHHHPSTTLPSAATCATTGPASTPPTSASCSSRSSGSTTPASSPAPASAWPASGASSNATAAGPGPKAPSTAAPPSTSPSTRRAPHERQADPARRGQPRRPGPDHPGAQEKQRPQPRHRRQQRRRGPHHASRGPRATRATRRSSCST